METEAKIIAVIILLILAFFVSLLGLNYLVNHRLSSSLKSLALMAIILFVCFLINKTS